MKYSESDILIMRMGKLLKQHRIVGWPTHIDIEKQIGKLKREMEKLADKLEKIKE